MLHVARSICDAPRWLGLWAQLPLQEKSLAPATKYTGHLSTHLSMKAVCSASTNRETRMSVTPIAFHSSFACTTTAGRTAPSASVLALSLLLLVPVFLPVFLSLKQDQCVFCSMYAKNGAKRAAEYSDDEPFENPSSIGWTRVRWLLNRTAESATGTPEEMQLGRAAYVGHCAGVAEIDVAGINSRARFDSLSGLRLVRLLRQDLVHQFHLYLAPRDSARGQ